MQKELDLEKEDGGEDAELDGREDTPDLRMTPTAGPAPASGSSMTASPKSLLAADLEAPDSSLGATVAEHSSSESGTFAQWRLTQTHRFDEDESRYDAVTNANAEEFRAFAVESNQALSSDQTNTFEENEYDESVEDAETGANPIEPGVGAEDGITSEADASQEPLHTQAAPPSNLTSTTPNDDGRSALSGSHPRRQSVAGVEFPKHLHNVAAVPSEAARDISSRP